MNFDCPSSAAAPFCTRAEGQVLSMINAIDGMINMTFSRPDSCSVAEWGPSPSQSHRNSEREAKPRASPTGFSHQRRRQTLNCTVAHADQWSIHRGGDGRRVRAHPSAAEALHHAPFRIRRARRHPKIPCHASSPWPRIQFATSRCFLVLVTDAMHPALASRLVATTRPHPYFEARYLAAAAQCTVTLGARYIRSRGVQNRLQTPCSG